MFLRRLAIICVALLLGVSVAQAGDANLNYSLNCAGFRSSGGSLVLNRDNTGTLQEAFVISAIDGSGNTIYEPDFDRFFVGTTVDIEAGAGGQWTSVPRYNPLFLQVVSPAGNGLDQQIIAQVAGNCPGLPTFDPIDVLAAFGREAVRRLTGESFVILPATGETDLPLPLNTAPPRPINPPGLPQELSGWAIVNTDNLTLRSGDGPHYEQIGVVDGGTELVVLGRNAKRSWYYVQVGGMRGWVTSEFLILRGDLVDTPIVPVTGAFAQPRLYVGFSGNPVYALPLAGAPVLCHIPGRLDYSIIGRTSNAAWYEIEVTCDTEETSAWIPAEFGAFRNPGGQHVPVTYGV